ncbi:MAG: hypothetical protein U1C74_26305 [Phenylobacterium sp.]|uniref:hypothetical protein n=1 Tax=Brevundimonas sp. TaxID=1871086 RepID=UPI002737FB7D|nr:hypothetical protein [Brevundimonas sp.]MDP3802769.1 hypothetical protein [Brevundimonas sp.]MDZ4374907.1 hypothetical protein [Phenylobacterium sp.]
MDGTGNGIGEGTAPQGRARGHVMLGSRMWARIAREYAAGASAPWLSDRYGAGERTIAARARKEGWRRKDLAEAADAELEAAEARGAVEPAPPPAIGPGLGLGSGSALDGSARGRAVLLEEALAGVTDEARAGAAREALDRAVAHMRTGDAHAATDWVKLAGALAALAGRDGSGSPEEAADAAAQAAAMAVLCERLGLAEDGGSGA